ncbi:M1 family metallopeptidase [Geodermatophilus sp. SYSU D01036]
MTAGVLVAMGTGTAVADGGGRGDPQPGAPGLGDPYFPLDGNGGYDVRHYGLDLRYDPATDVLAGTATITARATQSLSSFDLDLQGLEVRSVRVGGHAATWTRDGQELVVTPKHPLHEGRRFVVEVVYDGIPETIQDAFGASGFLHTDDGAVVAGQPHGAATWFPANDHPRDAASVAVSITVPEGLEGISNGELRGTRTRDGWTTWSWSAEEPMATYLVTLAVGEFDVREYQADGIAYWDAVDPDLATFDADPEAEGPLAGELVDAALARQPEVIAAAEGWFGPYPFSTSGGIVDDAEELTFALETQTRPVYSPWFFFDPVAAEGVVVHELAHQWYGDSVRLDAWQHIWLNEGFAIYAEWLWLEREGLSTPQQEFDTIATLSEEQLGADFWDVVIGDPGPATEQLFHSAVYYRGAMTLQALRNQVGDDAFFTILRTWATTQAGQTVTTDEFIAHAEQVSGQQLDDLFTAWLFTPGRPAGLPEPAEVPAA